MSASAKNSFEKRRIRKFVINRLKLTGNYFIDGKNVSCTKVKVIYSKYQELFKSNPILDFRRHERLKDKQERINAQKEKSKQSNENDYVYIIGNKKEGICKIGYSKNPFKRLKELQTGCPYKLEIFVVVRGNISTESLLQKKYKKYKSNGEWFFYKEDLKKSIESIENTEKDLKYSI